MNDQLMQQQITMQNSIYITLEDSHTHSKSPSIVDVFILLGSVLFSYLTVIVIPRLFFKKKK